MSDARHLRSSVAASWGSPRRYRLLEARAGPAHRRSSRRRRRSRPTRPGTTAASCTPGCTTSPARSRRRLCREGKVDAGALLRRRTTSRSSARGKLVVAIDEAELERFAALKERAIANGVRGPRGGRPGAHARDRAARGRHPGALEPGHGHRRLPAGSRWRTPTRCARKGGAIETSARGDVHHRARRRDGRRHERGDVVAPRRHRLCRAPGRPCRRDDRRGHGRGAADRALPGRLLHAHARRPAARQRASSTRCPTRASRSWASTSRSASTARSGPARTRCWRSRARATAAATCRLARPGRRLAYPGFLRLATKYWRTGVGRDVARLVSKRAFLAADAAVRARDPRRPDRVRADRACGPRRSLATARMVDDFLLGGSDHVLHVRNAPSPAATSSLAIGRVLAEEAVSRFGL